MYRLITLLFVHIIFMQSCSRIGVRRWAPHDYKSLKYRWIVATGASKKVSLKYFLKRDFEFSDTPKVRELNDLVVCLLKNRHQFKPNTPYVPDSIESIDSYSRIDIQFYDTNFNDFEDITGEYYLIFRFEYKDGLLKQSEKSYVGFEEFLQKLETDSRSYEQRSFQLDLTRYDDLDCEEVRAFELATDRF